MFALFGTAGEHPSIVAFSSLSLGLESLEDIKN